MMRRICSCLLMSFALWCTAAAYGQTGTVTVTIYSRLTIESNELLAECGTNISGASGFYKNVDSNCTLTTNSSIQPEQTVTACNPSNPSPAFNPSAQVPAPNLKVDCSQIFPLQNLGSIKYTLNSQHNVYTIDAFRNLFNPNLVDPCDFAFPRVGFPISPPSQSVELANGLQSGRAVARSSRICRTSEASRKPAARSTPWLCTCAARAGAAPDGRYRRCLESLQRA
jgi:hypothetical protein